MKIEYEIAAEDSICLCRYYYFSRSFIDGRFCLILLENFLESKYLFFVYQSVQIAAQEGIWSNIIKEQFKLCTKVALDYAVRQCHPLWHAGFVGNKVPGSEQQFSYTTWNCPFLQSSKWTSFLDGSWYPLHSISSFGKQ